MDRGGKNCWLSWRKQFGVTVTVLMLGIVIGSVLFAHAAFTGRTYDDAYNRQVIFVFRHGDRTPTESYPNDPYRNYEWNGGWGALTKKGMLQMYNVGRWIRKEYGSIIGSKYESSRSLVMSSYADRAIMSAQALLAAVYPPTPQQIFLPGLSWVPVPVHSTPRHLDKTVTVKAPCPRLEEALKEAYANESARPGTLPATYYRDLSIYTGQNMSTITDVEFLYNTLEIEEQNAFELPEWTSKYYNRNMREIAARSLAIFTSNALQQRLRGGPLLKEILEHMKTFHSGANTKRAYFYSAHDITLVNLLRTMGFTDHYFKPDYAATIVFQLQPTPTVTNDAELKLTYLNNSETAEPHFMEIPNCATPCLLSNLVNLWKPVIPDNWDDECQLPSR